MSENFKNIDDLFKDKFENFEQNPPPYIWENVKAGIAAGGGPKGGLRGGIAGFTAILIMIGAALVYLLSNSFTIQNTAGKNADQAQNLQHTPSQSLTIAPIDQNSLNTNENIVDAQPHKKAATALINQKNIAQTQGVQSTASRQLSEVPEQKIARTSLLVEQNHTVASSDDKHVRPELNNLPPQLTYIKFEEIGVQQKNQKGQPLSPQANFANNKVFAPPPADYGVKGEWLLGLYYRPEMIQYPADDKITNYSNGIDLLLQYKINNLFIQGGLGYSNVKDAGNYRIDYNKYLGSYEDVYDVTYDTVGNQVIPVYHTHTVDIYDSVNYVRISPSERVFGYIDIPVLFGFGRDYRRYSWFIKAGPTLSFKIYENIPDMNMSADEFKILNVENSLPARIKANWQFALSAGINYKLGNKLSLSVEPLMRYYINSEYEPGKFTTKHPYSLGLRTGLILGF